MVILNKREYEAVIGLEVHAQLRTNTKMFCSCGADYQGASPNTRACPVCIGMPGVLPVINKKAVEFVAMTGLALNCRIAQHTKFDRKNYPYPDLMKGYQISQYDEPIASNGWITLYIDGHEKRAGITRVHLEEDVAKLSHINDTEGDNYSLLDVNRAGVPLMEIVGDPDLRSSEEARQYLISLRSILQYLDVSSGNMEEGNFRCDANISIRPMGNSEMGTRVEIKNMNSFRSVYRALEFEFERQVETLSVGNNVVQETRGWVEEHGVTISLRSKEYAHDYRYFTEPDLPPIVMSRDWVDSMALELPELPDARRSRYIKDYGLELYDAALLTSSKATANFFESVVSFKDNVGTLQERAKSAANWIIGEVARLLKTYDVELETSLIRPDHLAELLELIDIGTLSITMAKSVFEETFTTGITPGKIVNDRGLNQISDVAGLDVVVEESFMANNAAVLDYLEGKEAALKFLVGQVMKITHGQANPTMVTEVVKQKLAAMKSK